MIQRVRNVFVLLCLALVAGSGLGWSGAGFAQPPAGEAVAEDALAGRRRALEEEAAMLFQVKGDLEARRRELQQQRRALTEVATVQANLEEARLAVEAARVQVEAATLDRLAAEREVSAIQAEIRQQEERLKAMLAGTREPARSGGAKPAIAEAEARLESKKAQLAIEQQHVTNVVRHRELMEEQLRLAEEWLGALRERHRLQQEATRREALEDFSKRKQKEQEEAMGRAADLREQLRQLSAEAAEGGRRHLLQTRLTEAEESAYLAQLEIKTARARHELARWEEQAAEGGEGRLRTALEGLHQLGLDLLSAHTITARKLSVLEQQLQVMDKRRELEPESRKQVAAEQRVLNELISRFQAQLKTIEPVLATIDSSRIQTEEAYKSTVRRGLTVRHVLPAEAPAWSGLAEEIGRLPATAASAVADTFRGLSAALQRADSGQWLMLVIAEVFWVAICFLFLRVAERHGARAEPAGSFAAKAKLVTADLLLANRFAIPLFGILLWAAWITEVTAPGLAVFAATAGLWVGTRLLVGLARWLLNSPLVPLERRRPGLYRLVVAAGIGGAGFSAVLLLGHLGLLTPALRDLLDRVFMLYLLFPAYVGLHVHPLLMEVAEERLQGRHWLQLVRLVDFAIPASMLVAAILGLAGYINLAWVMAQYLAMFMAVAVVWLVLRALLRDFANRVKDKINLHSAQGLLWAQGIVEPIHRVMRLGLFITALFALFQLYGWDAKSDVVAFLTLWLSHPLLTVGQSTINTAHLLGTLSIVVLTVWLGRWIRQFTYRWLYADVADLGVRNSLSVFSQYAFVLLGLLVALNTLGLDLTSLAIFAGALGVGIGFGLQTIANNFVSGIILLAERPLRAGDWVTIGDKEGEVSRIGIRSVTVTTWDNQDVIIPNADIVSGSFTNWTHSDNVVRTVLNIRISYQDDPHRAADVLLEAVYSHPDVMDTPRPQVWLSGFGDSSVDFWVQYFTDVRKARRLQVKSDVLFAVWDRLKAAGITIPYPQRDIYVREWPAMGQHPPQAEPVPAGGDPETGRMG